MPENDDDISIDFSKIKNFFKKRSEKKVETPKVSENTHSQISTSQDVPSHASKDDEEVSFDFTKVKNFFKNLSKKNEASSEEDISIDFKKVGGFIKKYQVFLLILIPLFFAVYLRMMPAYLPITDDWANSHLLNVNRDIITQQIRAQYPNVPSAQISAKVEEEVQKLIKNNEILVPTAQGIQKAPFKDALSQYSAGFRERLQLDGQTYLIAIDPYFWMRHAKNILDHGNYGDELRNIDTGEICDKISKKCVPWNTHMIAPLGRPEPTGMLHAYVVAYTHKFLSIFNPDQTLMGSAFIVPVILSALCVIPGFFIGRRVAGNFGGVVGAFMIAIHPAFLTRTVGGFSDTDAYNVLFPLLVTWFFLEGFETKNFKKSMLLVALAGICVGIYAELWIGWWYIFDFLLASIVIFTAMYILIRRDRVANVVKDKTIKHSVIVLLVFFIASMISVTVADDFNGFIFAFQGPFNFAALKEVGISSVWPNVFTTVAEQNTASLGNVVSQIGLGSMILFFFAILGISLTLLKKQDFDKDDIYYLIISSLWFIGVIAYAKQKNYGINLMLFLVLISLPIIVKLLLILYNKNTKVDIKLAVILIIWFTSTLYASTKGVRFLLLLVPAFSIGLGATFGLIYKHLSKFISKSLYLNRYISKSVIMLLLLLFLINPFRAAYSTALNEIPSMNDAWYASLDKINQEAAPDAIINSWWDFGHWFKAIGDRAVTFDGTSQGTPMAHWIGYSLLTNDENDAIGVLRMLDCASNNAFEVLNKEINDVAKSVGILHEIVKMDRGDAEDYLLKYVDKNTAENVLKDTHCTPPEDYYITSDDMIGKSGVWAHFGSWDFDRALIYNTYKKNTYKTKEEFVSFLEDRFGYSADAAEDMYYDVRGVRTSDEANTWIAPWPSYASGVSGCSFVEDEVLSCPLRSGSQGSLNIIVSLANKTADILTPQGKLHPNAVVFPTKDGIEKFTYNNNTLGYSMTLIPNGDNWNFVMMLPPLEDSIFTRLYFLNGHGLKNFEKFSEQTSVVGNRIVVWKVSWDGEAENLVYFQTPEESVDTGLNISDDTVLDEQSNESVVSDEETQVDSGITENNSVADE